MAPPSTAMSRLDRAKAAISAGASSDPPTYSECATA
jgi:hypothetical protein